MAKSFGRYEILERLSKGGMAEVFKGRSSGAAGFEKVVAIKRILPSLSTDPMFVSMFIEEAKLSANLNHVNIAQIYEFGELDGQYFIAMEYVHGKDLRALQRHFRQSGASMPVAMALRIATDICSALDYAHNRKDATGRKLQIVHRDISPPNVLISFEGAVKLIDFGIAKALTRSRSTATGMLKGKLGYLSPEQAEGRELDGRSDLFALGTVLWELLTGVRLFHEATDMATLLKVRRAEVAPPSELNPDIPAAVDAIVLKALSRDVEERFQRADLFYEALEAVTRQPGLAFTPIQLARFMTSTFSPARDEQTAVATPSPSPLRVEVLAPEPALEAAPKTPRPAPLPARPKPAELFATGPQPLLSREAARAELESDPSTRVSDESAQLARKLTTPAPPRALEDRTGPTRVPAQRPHNEPAKRGVDSRPAIPLAPEPKPASARPETGPRRRPDAVRGALPQLHREPAPTARRGGAASQPDLPAAGRRSASGEGRPADAWNDETKDLHQHRKEPAPALASTPTPAVRPALTLQGGWGDLDAAAVKKAAAGAASADGGEDWEDGPTTLKEEPAARALAAIEIDPAKVVPLDERETPAAPLAPNAEVLRPVSERKAPSRSVDLGELIESSIGTGAEGRPPDWPEPMESPEIEQAGAPTPVDAPASPPAAPPAAAAAPPGALWDDGPTRFEPEGSPAMAAELGAEHAQGEADRMVLEPIKEEEEAVATPFGASEDESALPLPGRPAPRAPRWPWLLLGVAVLALIAAVLVLVLR